MKTSPNTSFRIATHQETDHGIDAQRVLILEIELPLTDAEASQVEQTNASTLTQAEKIFSRVSLDKPNIVVTFAVSKP